MSSAYVEDKIIINLGDFNIDLSGKHPHQYTWLLVICNYELSQLVTNYDRLTATTNHELTIHLCIRKHFSKIFWCPSMGTGSLSSLYSYFEHKIS